MLGSTGHIMMVLSKLKNIKVSGVSSRSHRRRESYMNIREFRSFYSSHSYLTTDIMNVDNKIRGF